ncbi:hypothetical protein [Sulfobacillus harzensis]|uniref:Uncharacterized protein n=1 Tax=Sulfobacillus harzensis TaxID=2729629 RepID=A0A7Y0L682_9FIRM|nr:hypothetical protein [Sulfobacillus harzensis]NMP24042.1 hypothetical protein [Sulfobacillus harzensis]
MNNQQRIEMIEKEVGEDLGKLPAGMGMLLKTVVFPQLKTVPDTELPAVREAVAHIILMLKKAFDL